MSKLLIEWKEVTRVEKFMDDEDEINVLHHVIYDESGTEIFWDDSIIYEAIMSRFFRRYPDAVLDLKIDFKAGVHWSKQISNALILAQMVKHIFNEETDTPFSHGYAEEEWGKSYLNLVYGESEKLFFDNVCRVMDHLEFDLTKFKAWLIPNFEDEDDK
ncbi:MAG: hypothetical protein Q8N01_04360 [Sulfuricurvum sp.]|nr:hypothetical protein [Sulfuricurvum sp.]